VESAARGKLLRGVMLNGKRAKLERVYPLKPTGPRRLTTKESTFGGCLQSAAK
jgi:hypothetical protein